MAGLIPPPAPTLTREELIAAARRSPYIFTRYLLGYNQLATEHRAWDDIMRHDRFIALMPRECRKSTVFVVGATVQAIADDPIGFCGLLSTHDNRETIQRIRAIQRGLTSPLVQEYQPRLKYLVGRKGEKAKKWTETTIDLRDPADPSSAGRTENTLDGVTSLVSSVGGHFRRVIFDDVIDVKDKMSQAVRNARLEYFTNTEDLVKSDGGQWWIVGTRWHPEDAYKTVLKEWKEFAKYVRGIYNDERTPGLPQGDLWLPQYYQHRLERLKRNPIRFSLQYLNEPVADSERAVDLSWFRIVNQGPDEDDVLVKVIGVDPAYGSKDLKNSCYRAAAVLCITKDKRVYLLDGAINRERLSSFRDKYVFPLDHKHGADYTCVENNGPQEGALELFQDKSGWCSRVEGTEANLSTDKLSRAQPWLLWAEREGIYVVPGPWWDEASYQLDLFPGGQYNDFPDAISNAWPRLRCGRPGVTVHDREVNVWGSTSLLGT